MYPNILRLPKKENKNPCRMYAFDGEVEWEKEFFPFRAYWKNGWVLGYAGVSMNLSKNCSDVFGCKILYFKLIVCPKSWSFSSIYFLHCTQNLTCGSHLPELRERQHFVHWGSCLVATSSNAFISRFGGPRKGTMSTQGSFRKIFCFCCHRRNHKGTSSPQCLCDSPCTTYLM